MSHFESGNPEVRRMPKELGAGYSAMGEKGYGGLRRALMGSISDPFVGHATCPVAVVGE